MKVCSQCHYWQPPESTECDECGSALDTAPQQVPTLAAREADLGTTPEPGSSSAAPKRRSASPAPRRRLLVVGVVAASVALCAVAAFATVDRVGDGGEWTRVPSPLARSSIELPGQCHDLALAEEELKVTSAAVGCVVDEGVELAVVEFDFGGAELDAIDPRFLVGSILASHEGGVVRPVVDTFDGPTTGPNGEVYEFTGRGVLHGSPVKTVGSVVIAGNRGVVLVGSAPERDSVTEAYERLAASLTPA